MKYGQHLSENIAPEYGILPYLQYRLLDDIIRAISKKATSSYNVADRQLSLSSPPPTDSTGKHVPQFQDEYNDDKFFSVLDDEMAKVEKFTLSKVTELRAELTAIEEAVENLKTEEDKVIVQKDTELVAQGFLRLEKYVNLNFMGFHKILKKHDKYIPSNPCKDFYVKRMHNQSWVRGDYSDLVVRLSSIYSTLREDRVVEEEATASQNFLRTTTKYWVKTEDVSRVKYQVLKHLPVFLQNAASGESDSQLTNSVYLDNNRLELYHGRLDKTNGGQAIRLRWYGTGDPSLVFVERKTHKETWAGETSVKERFTVHESEVKNVMTDNYNIEEVKKEMETVKGLSTTQADDWERLARGVTQVISSKQLVPTMRTQYMRTAFQIPFDATVRISLDTNLCMISERGYNLDGGKVWHRNSSKPIAPNEITRFPHAVLEIKLELNNENSEPPLWVQELQSSGMLYEVHKFSKFLHGCATLLSEDVMNIPYWVDDISLRNSIAASDAEWILVKENEANDTSVKSGTIGLSVTAGYEHLLPFGTITDKRMNIAIGKTTSSFSTITGPPTKRNSIVPKYNEDDALEFGQNYKEEEEEDDEDEDDDDRWISYCCPKGFSAVVLAPTPVQKIEPKAFFAIERRFLHWLHSGVTLMAISSAILAFSTDDSEYAHWYAFALMFVSLGFCIYALKVLLWRTDRIRSRVPGRWDDPRGPIFLGITLCLVLLVNFVYELDWLIASFSLEERQ